jgi:hypothetical protein
MAVKKGNFLPKKGNLLPLAENPLRPPAYYERVIASAIRRELAGSHKSEKTLMRWTGASGRTVKNWASGLRGPNGVHLIALMRNSDEVLKAVLNMAGRTTKGTPHNIAAVRIHLLDSLALLAAETADTRTA